MSKEAMCILRTLMDAWLPNFKFGPGKCALDLSRTPWYLETVTNNLRLLHDWEEDFVIRYLIMPNHIECCTKPVLDWIAKNMQEVPINIMDQYYPDNIYTEKLLVDDSDIEYITGSATLTPADAYLA